MRRHERLIVAAAVLGLLALWEILARLGRIDASLAPAPTTVLDSLLRLAGRPEVRASLGVTAWEVAAAFLIALPTGLLTGFLLAEVPLLARSSGRWSTSFSGCPSRSSCPCSSWCSG
jgi:ABC-type nitrate/sulfonate/bicarbonate transport system permease component